MRAKTRTGTGENELRFELKYCERCGGLWLRPAGGGQVYCAACGREMAELPPATRTLRTATLPLGPRWGTDNDEGNDEDGGMDLTGAGGVA